MASIQQSEVDGLLDELRHLHQRVEDLEAQQGDGWLRGSEMIGRYVGLSGAAVRRRKSQGGLPQVIRQGRDLVAKRAELDAWLRRNGAR